MTDGADALNDGAEIPLDRTAVPVEWDQIKEQLGRAADALGPDGDDRGPAADFLDGAGSALAGNGEALGRSVTELSEAMSTLDEGGADLFGTIRGLQTFTTALRRQATNRSFSSKDDWQMSRVCSPRAGRHWLRLSPIWTPPSSTYSGSSNRTEPA